LLVCRACEGRAGPGGGRRRADQARQRAVATPAVNRARVYEGPAGGAAASAVDRLDRRLRGLGGALAPAEDWGRRGGGRLRLSRWAGLAKDSDSEDRPSRRRRRLLCQWTNTGPAEELLARAAAAAATVTPAAEAARSRSRSLCQARNGPAKEVSELQRGGWTEPVTAGVPVRRAALGRPPAGPGASDLQVELRVRARTCKEASERRQQRWSLRSGGPEAAVDPGRCRPKRPRPSRARAGPSLRAAAGLPRRPRGRGLGPEAEDRPVPPANLGGGWQQLSVETVERGPGPAGRGPNKMVRTEVHPSGNIFGPSQK
jgi:hypothetical protein